MIQLRKSANTNSTKHQPISSESVSIMYKAAFTFITQNMYENYACIKKITHTSSSSFNMVKKIPSKKTVVCKLNPIL